MTAWTPTPLEIGDGVVGAEENTPEEDAADAKRAAQSTPEMKAFAQRMADYADELIASVLGDQADELAEAYNANQPRYPKGHAKAGQWRPKLSTGAGRLAPGHLARDLSQLKQMVDQYGSNPSQHTLNAIGTEIEKTALRYSARKHYVKRLDDLRAQRTAIQDKMWEGWEQAFRDMTPEEYEQSDPKDFITPAEREQMENLSAEELRLFRDRDHADIDAMLGVLREIRPMGGKLNQDKASYAVDQASGIEREFPTNTPREVMKSDLDKSLSQVLKLIPTKWLDDTNAKGRTSWLFSNERAYASTSLTEAKRPDDSFRKMEDTVDLALAGKLRPRLADGVASDLMEAFPKDVGIDSPEANSWRDRRDELAKQLADQKFTWVGRAKTSNYPDTGLWAVIRGEQDKREYYVDWGGDLHLLDDPKRQSGITSDKEIIRRPRDDRRLTKGALPLTTAQQAELERAIGQGGSYEGMYDSRYPVVRRPGTEEGGVGPYAAIYDWIDDKGNVKNIHDRYAGPSGFDEALWDRSAPRPPVLESSHDTLIRVDPRNPSTVLHELSHRLERVYGEENRAGYTPISMATHAFLNARTAGEPTQKLKDLYPDLAYEDHEYTRPDKFIDAYIGKLYSGNATEVLTMGMEALFYPKYADRDINDDPEMRRLILGMLASL